MLMMSRVKIHNLAAIAAIAVIVATVVVIFVHSMQGTDASWVESNIVAALFEPLLRRVYGLFCGVVSWTGHAVPLDYGTFVRRLAHFIEYFLLGAGCTGLTVALTKRTLSPYLWSDLFFVLMIAVLDEFVQSFVGRSSLVKDILLDFSGGITGFLIVLIVAALMRRGARSTRSNL